MLESEYQSRLIDRLEKMFPGCIVLNNDPHKAQGLPDLFILYKKKWAMLEVKASIRAKEQPNQRWWIDTLNEMSFAAFIYPENEEDVLYDLQQTFGTRRKTRISLSQ